VQIRVARDQTPQVGVIGEPSESERPGTPPPGSPSSTTGNDNHRNSITGFRPTFRPGTKEILQASPAIIDNFEKILHQNNIECAGFPYGKEA
jgi:hypothetical protein